MLTTGYLPVEKVFYLLLFGFFLVDFSEVDVLAIASSSSRETGAGASPAGPDGPIWLGGAGAGGMLSVPAVLPPAAAFIS